MKRFSENEIQLINAILNKNLDDFISAIETGAPLIGNSIRRVHWPSIPQIQAMIEFVIALDAKGVERKVTAEYLRTEESAATFRLFATFEANALPAAFERLISRR